MKKLGVAFAFILLTSTLLFCYAQNKLDRKWAVHSMDRPVPRVVTPGAESTQDQAGTPPSDAIVLFDGKDLSKWTGANNSPAPWTIENGYAQVSKGSITTKDSFGDCQLHLEWMTPTPPKGDGQARGNSGVYLMNVYELQILDSFENRTYADGQAASIYGQAPPLVNASRPPGQWQSYDIIFHRPHFSADGKVEKPARVTILHNGVLVQDNFEIQGGTAKPEPTYTPHADKAPITLQDHGQPVRFRNIWIRPLDP